METLKIDISHLVEPIHIISGDGSGDIYGGWDRHGNTREIQWRRGGGLIDRSTYTFDRAGQRLTRVNSTSGGNDNEVFTYDGLRQLKTRTRAITQRKEEFSYDSIGNWSGYDVWENETQTLDQSRVHNTPNMLTQIDGSSALLAHDPAGNLTKCPPDAAGDWSDSHQLKWDAWNRLAEVRDGAGTLIAAYEYDGLMRRTKAVTTEVISGVVTSGVVTDTYYNSKWRPVEERINIGGNLTTNSYDWGLRYRDDLVRRSRKVGSDAPVVNYALHDYYNVTAITNSTGSVVERYRYSGFRELSDIFIDAKPSNAVDTLLMDGEGREDNGYLIFKKGGQVVGVFLVEPSVTNLNSVRWCEILVQEDGIKVVMRRGELGQALVLPADYRKKLLEAVRASDAAKPALFKVYVCKDNKL